MDLENFGEEDSAITQSSSTSHVFEQKAEDIVQFIDDHWYRPTARRGRWMDLIGDYAGREPFVIDGDAILQLVLEDPLLSVGNVKGNTGANFQILHAFYLLERILLQYTQRFAEIEIVFWRSTKEAVTIIGVTPFVVSSRMLARRYLSAHIRKLGIPVHEFESPRDPSWLEYYSKKKPMFVMTNDGGSLSKDSHGLLPPETTLFQRMHVYALLSSKIPIALLKGAEYRDSKILTFILESGPKSPQIDRQFGSILKFVNNTLGKRLRERVKLMTGKHSLTDRSSLPGQSAVQNVTDFLGQVVAAYPSHLPPEILYIFALHAIVLPSLSVHERAQSRCKLHPDLEELLVEDFFPKIFFTMATSTLRSLFEIDGGVFRRLVQMATNSPHHSICDKPDLPASVLPFFTHFRRKFNLDFPSFAARFPSPHESNALATVGREEPPYELLPFENQVFNSKLLDVTLPTQEDDSELLAALPKLSHGISFLDNQHWHSQRMILPDHLGGESIRPVDERHRRAILKRAQRFMANLQSQAATLTGASGNVLQQMVIPAISSSRSDRAIKNSEHKSKNTYRGKAKGLSSADKRRQQIAEEKATREQEESERWWEEKLKSLSKSSTLVQLSSVDALLRNKRAQEKRIGLELRLYRIHLELLSWIEIDERDTDEARDKHTVAIIRMVKELLFDKKWPMGKAAAKAVSSTLQSLGFHNLCGSVHISDELGGSLHFKFVKLVSSRTNTPYHDFMCIKEDPVTWQLRLFGEFMDRSMDSAPDPRVQFEPDAWQREVLDCVDANMSLLVVAPTSAGKTFISYYAMEQVLRASDEGILVYVAPTKALVTQITAEIYARFSKTMTGKTCWAIHTRDWRINDPQKCQILVTVPEVLSIMLLSPPLAKVWTPRLKRIVLDEIHSIGQHEGGAVWEQIILLAPCPIIGLSATIGSPEIFNEWLESVQRAHKFEHRFIQWPHRYSHLRKFFYDSHQRPELPFKDLVSHRPSQRMHFLHPISLMAFGARSLPPDLALEPRDLLTLYEALKEEGSFSQALEGLEPTIFFSSRKTFLRQSDVLGYEAKLKAIISGCVGGGAPQSLSEALSRVISTLEDSKLSSKREAIISLPSKEAFKNNLIHLLADLNSRGELPAIIFNFDRTECEIMAQTILRSLETAEEAHRSNSKSWKAKLIEWERWKANSKERERQAERMKKQKSDDTEAAAPSAVPWQSTFDPSEPSEEFSFAGLRSGYSRSELEDELRALDRWTPVEKWVLEALKRGIAVHHAGMNKRYRSLVEGLFRRGYVRVIIATGTLALGINAPAKTCIFSGDSPYLTALMYRQCGGRAGRRGYDLLGNVIFYGISYDRVQRLVLSQLPVLGGSFPITSTLTMRLLNLLEGSDYAPVATSAVTSILSMPQVGFRSQMGRQQLSHHVRFSIELLRRSRLIDEKGRPINMFAIAAHLYYTEPSNFLLVTLLQQGVLHAICAENSPESAQREFILVMAHLFGRRYLPQVLADETFRTQMSKIYPSMILLPPLPKAPSGILQAYNKLVLQSSVGYMISYASHQADHLGVDDTLPLSKESYSGTEEFPSLRSQLQSTALKFSARSAFAANSGHGDSYASVKELANTIRDGLYLHEHAIPSLDESNSSLTEKQGDGGKCLNAYLLDFYTHGQLSTIAAANGIRRGDIWYLLDDFLLTLKTIKSALEQLLKRSSTDANPSEDIPVSDLVDLIAEDGDDDGEGISGGLDEDDEDAVGITAKPKGVTDADWKVYEVVCAATNEFEAKFKAIWA